MLSFKAIVSLYLKLETKDLFFLSSKPTQNILKLSLKIMQDFKTLIHLEMSL